MSADYTSLGVTDPSGSLAAVTALVLLFVLWLRDAARALAAGVALVTLLFAAAAFTTGFPFVHAYGGWLGISCAGAASLVFLTDRALVGSIQRPTAYAAAVVGSATAAVASFFLPWQTACYCTDADLNGTGLAGSCISSNGFAFGVAASTATLLTIVLAVVVAMLPWLRQIVAPLEAAVGLGLLTVTLGFRVETGDSGDATLGIGYGAIVGFVAIGTLIALTLVSMRWRRPNLRAVAPRVVPISLAAVFIAVVVVPWWGVLPDTIWRTFVPRFAALSWLTLASALIGIRLAFAWWRQAMGVDRAPELVLLSVGLVALTVLDATPLPSIEVNWNEGLLFALTLPLLLLALIEERGGLRNMRVPEVLRVDRL